jgi:hypothetical protein
MFRYKLRTLLIVLALGPPVLAGSYFALQAFSAPAWAVALGVAQFAFWLVILFLVIRRAATHNRP